MRIQVLAVGIAFLIMNFFSVLVVAQAGGCSPTDIFLKSSDENAHGADCGSGSSYTFPVSWGNIQTRSCLPPGNPRNVVIRLSSADNAHAEVPYGNATYTLDPSYIDICFGDLECDRTDDPVDTCMYSLSSTNNAHIGTCSNTNYPIKVYCSSASGGAPVCGNGVLEASEQCDDGNTANGDGCSSTCTNETSTCPDPVARMVSPPTTANCDVFGALANVSFRQSQPEDNTCFNYRWDIGNGVFFTTWNASYVYPTTGQRHITLTVTRIGDGMTSMDERDLLIVNTTGDNGIRFVCAKISAPQEGDVFNTTQYILFSGNQSFALEKYSEGGNDKLRCLAGACPLCITNPDGTVDSPCPGQKQITLNTGWTDLDQPAAWSNLNFLWEFGDGQVYFNLSINGSIYNKLFARAGTYLNKLTVMIADDPSINGSDSVTIGVELAPGCHNGKRTFVDALGNEFQTNQETSPGSGVSTFNQCGGLDGNPATPGDNCCAGSEGWRCEDNPAALGNYSRCVRDLPPGFCSMIFSCGNYSTQADCNADLCGAAEPGGVVGVGCIIGSGRCRCMWNTTISACVSRCDVNCSFPKFGTPGNPGDCIKTYTQGPCVNQQFVLSWVASLAGVLPPTESAASLGCVPGSRTYPCGRVARLAFFTLRNVIGVVVLLAAFYLIINRKKIAQRFGKR